MSADVKKRNRKVLIWPVAGMALGAVAMNVLRRTHLTFEAGIAALFGAMALVLVIAANPTGARIGVLAAGLLLAVPCLVRAPSLDRGMLMCLMCVPYATAAAFVFVPSFPSLRARLAYLCSWCGLRRVTTRARGFDAAACVRMLAATAVFAAALAVVKATPARGFWLPVRWLAGGGMVLAVAEMGTACEPLLASAVGIAVPPWFQSPYRSASINEFWTRRWNLCVSAIFRRFCLPPLARHGVMTAVLVIFFLSGVAHTGVAYMATGRLAISLACGAFFLAQAPFIAAERWLNVRRWRPAAGHAWTLAVLAVTSPLFIEPLLQVVEPSLNANDHSVLQAGAVLGFVLALSGIIVLASYFSLPPAVTGQTEQKPPM